MLRLAAVPVAATLFAFSAAAAESPDYAVDFGTFAPPASGGEFVEVNVNGSLLRLAARIVGQKEPQVAALLDGLKSVQVRVVGMDDQNREALATRAASIRDDLARRGWQPVVTAKSDGDDASVLLKLGADDAVEGIVVTVLAGDGEAVFVNVVGNIRPEQLAMLGECLDLPPLKYLPKAEK